MTTAPITAKKTILDIGSFCSPFIVRMPITSPKMDNASNNQKAIALTGRNKFQICSTTIKPAQPTKKV